MRSSKIGNVQEYLNVIDELFRKYSVNAFDEIPGKTDFLFRGISNKVYKLIPGVFRKVQNNKAPGKYSPKYVQYNKESDILNDFIAEASSYILNISHKEKRIWLEYAQHYGVPTRLLDWTSSPLVALYFACINNPNKQATVWVLHHMNYRNFLRTANMNKLNSSSINEYINKSFVSEEDMDTYPIIYKPYYVDKRMSAQSSYFMYWGKSKFSFDEMIIEKYQMEIESLEPNKERGFGIKEETEFLFPIEIYNDSKQEILRQLDTFGINEKTLFPGLDGVGRYIERKYRFSPFMNT